METADAAGTPGTTEGEAIRQFAITRLPGAFGAEIVGLDLRQPLTAAADAAIKTAFLEQAVLVIRDQKIDRAAMKRFAETFGELEPHAVALKQFDGQAIAGVHLISNLDADGLPVEKPVINSNYFWHSDKSYLPNPALATFLCAQEIPPSGGDTQFANLAAAYAALPASTKARIDGLKVVHSLEYMRISTGNAPPTAEERGAAPPVVNPLVRVHPETRRKGLFLGMYASHVVGMDEAESRRLIDELTAHATSPPFVYTHQWRPGDLVVWDNRCTMHRAIANFEMGRHRRILMRCVVKGGPAY
jgi:alpha-ketoglutarate-dependent taurine dioxygenase